MLNVTNAMSKNKQLACLYTVIIKMGISHMPLWN